MAKNLCRLSVVKEVPSTGREFGMDVEPVTQKTSMSGDPNSNSVAALTCGAGQ